MINPTAGLVVALTAIVAPASATSATTEVERVRPDMVARETLPATVSRRFVLEVHRRAPIDDQLLGAVMTQVARIWEPYGFAVAWGEQPASATDRDVPLSVVIDGAGPSGESGTEARSAIGWVEFLAPDQPRNVLHVSLVAARRLMDGARLVGRPLDAWPDAVRSRFMAQAIGRSLAHEIGHYMLRTAEHAETGLMREAFSPDELLESDLDRYGLEDHERSRLVVQPCADVGRNMG